MSAFELSTPELAALRNLADKRINELNFEFALNNLALGMLAERATLVAARNRMMDELTYREVRSIRAARIAAE